MNEPSKPAPLRMWAVFKNPTDYPDQFVARLNEISAAGVVPTETVIISENYDVIERQMLELGLFKLDRSVDDEPHVLESWV